jgi:hypothetical protein
MPFTYYRPVLDVTRNGVVFIDQPGEAWAHLDDDVTPIGHAGADNVNGFGDKTQVGLLTPGDYFEVQLAPVAVPSGDRVVSATLYCFSAGSGQTLAPRLSARVGTAAYTQLGTLPTDALLNSGTVTTLVGNGTALRVRVDAASSGVHNGSDTVAVADVFLEVETTTAVPTVNIPQRVVGTGGDTLNTVTWSAPLTATAAITEYRVYTVAGGTATRVGTVTGAVRSFTHTGLVNGRTYRYVVRSYNGTTESGNSNQVAGTPNPLGLVEKAGGQPAAASTVTGGSSAQNANDMDPATVWLSLDASDTEWWTVDLGAPRQITRASVVMSTPASGNTQIQSSSDYSSWFTRASAPITGGTTTTLNFASASARYWRVLLTP